MNELINKISNLTLEYIDQITSDGRVNLGEIYFKTMKIENENVITMDIYVFQTNFIRHFNTHIKGTNTVSFSSSLLNKIASKYSKNKDYKLNPYDKKVITLTRSRKEALPCTINITLDFKTSDPAIKKYNEKISKQKVIHSSFIAIIKKERKNKMNENLELLEFIYKTSSMGISSTTDLLKFIKEKDNKIKKESENILKTYEKYFKESEKLLKKYKTKGEDESIMVKAMSTMGIKKEVKDDNSDAHLADVLIQGLTMGNLEINKRITNYQKEVDKKILSLAKEFVKDFEIHIENLKKYL